MRIFIDTDCGVDDALALAALISWSGVEVAGITSTSGNTSAPQAASNVEVLLEVMGNHTPVISGPDPGSLFSPRDVHGSDGLGGYGSAPVEPTGLGAADAVREFCEAAGGSDLLLCLGPLTNLAEAGPTSCPRIVAVGGAGILGESDPCRDPNSQMDIAATTWVANNLSVDWVTINAGARVWLRESDFRSVTPTGRFLRAIHESYGWRCASQARRSTWSPSAYDTLAAVAATSPQVSGWEQVSAVVDGASLWGAPGGRHRMLSAESGAALVGQVRSAVAQAVS